MYASAYSQYTLGENMGFPVDKTTDTLSGLGSIVIPQDLTSNVAKLHEFLFGTVGYTPSSTVQTINGNIISPRILGSVIGLPSVWVITAIILMGAYFGPVGWFIGVPLFMVLYRVIGDLANRSLQKKGLPSSLSRYGSPQHIPNANQKNPSDEEESMP